MDQIPRMLPLRHSSTQNYIEMITEVNNSVHSVVRVINIDNSQYVDNTRKANSATYADTKELNYRTMVRKYSCRNNTRGWLVKGNLRKVPGPGREQHYTRKGRRLR